MRKVGKPTLRRSAERWGDPRPRPPPPARGDATPRAGLRRRPRRPGSTRPPRGGPRGARRTAGARRPARPRFHGTTQARHAAAGHGRRPPHAPAPLGRSAGLAERRRAAARPALPPAGPLGRSRRHATTTAPPARPPAGPLLPPGGRASGGRAPPPAPEADATESRAGVASARGLPDDRPAATGTALPRPPPPRRTVGAPYRGHAPGGRRTALSRGDTPALHVSTRRAGGGAPPRPPARLPFGPHAAGKGDGDATGRARDGTAAGDGGRLPADRPRRGDTRRAATPPLGKRGRPRSRAPADGGPAERSPPGRAVRRGGGRRPAPPVPSRSKAVEGREARPRRGRGAAPARDRGDGQGESAAGPGGRNPAAEEGRRAGALRRRRPLRRGERVGPAADHAPRPLRRGRAAERGGQGAPPRRGAVTRTRARAPAAGRRRRRRARPVATDTTAGDQRERLPTPQWRRATARRTCRRRRRRRRRRAAATRGARRAARVFKPPPGFAGPFGPPQRLTTPRAAWGPPRRGALGTWPWGEGNDLHGPAGVPPPLPPSGERPPAGARPTSAATAAASFSGPGVSLSNPALRPRGRPRLGPPRRRGDAARPPSNSADPAEGPRRRTGRPTPRPPPPRTPAAAGRTRGETRAPQSAARNARRRKAPAPRCGKGRRSRLLRAQKARPATRPLAIPTSAADRRDGRTAGRRSTGEAARGGAGAPPGGGRAAHPSLPAPGRPLGARAPKRAGLGRTRAPPGRPRAGVRTSGPAFGGAGRGGERLGAGRPPGSPAGDGPTADRREGKRGGGKAPRRRRRGRRASKPGRDARSSAGRAPPARTVTGATPAPSAAPAAFLRPGLPPGGAARPLLSRSPGPAARGGAAARPNGRRAFGKGVWPPGAGRGRRAGGPSVRTERGPRERVPPPTDSQVRPSSRRSGRAVADPAGADPRTSLNHPIDMHGLSFETSICYWQDQPGSRHPRRRRGAAREPPDARPAGERPANPDRPGSFTAPTRGSGIADATVAAWRRRAPAAAAGGIAARRRLGRGTARRARGPAPPPNSRRAAGRRGTNPRRRPTPAAGPSRDAAGKEPGPLRSCRDCGTSARLDLSLSLSGLARFRFPLSGLLSLAGAPAPRSRLGLALGRHTRAARGTGLGRG
ncbi:collagen alpha-1(I) chain-like [Haemorhous mexicanus]|uniref:collagen alpha-1(I) chain-like n=1 Tax=Haemorhous mexicanus TaxID=30427 RepID=UPI0028BEB3A9|nr:collagen alpha-1(I) chain-like [Haemorhous mexicanus]